MEQNKITSRQLIVMLAIVMMTSIFRSLPKVAAQEASSSAWMLPIGVFLVSLPLYLLAGWLLKRGSPAQLIEDVFGKAAGKALLCLVCAVILIYAFLAVRMVGELFVTSIYSQSRIEFFIAVFILVSLMMSKGKLTSLSRFSALMVIVLAFSVLLPIILSVANMQPDNFLPVANDDYLKMLKILPGGISLCAIVFYSLFLADRVSDREYFTKELIILSIVLMVLEVGCLLFTTAILGADLMKSLYDPFFAALKSLNLSLLVQRPEVFMVSVWMIPELFQTVILCKVLCTLLAKIAGIDNAQALATPIHLLILAGAVIVAPNYTAISAFQYGFINYVALGLVLIIFLGLPVVGKLRKKL